MARRPDSAAPSTRHPSQLLALAIGAVYTLVGVLGFLVTGLEDFAAETDKTLLGFEINPLHNIVHLLIGLAGLVMWRRLDTARTYGWLLAAGYGLAFIYGLFAPATPTSTSYRSTAPTTACTWPAPSPGWPSPSGRRREPPAAASPTVAPDRNVSPGGSHGAPTRTAADSSRRCCCMTNTRRDR
jgi:hypothetical protein